MVENLKKQMEKLLFDTHIKVMDRRGRESKRAAFGIIMKLPVAEASLVCMKMRGSFIDHVVGGLLPEHYAVECEGVCLDPFFENPLPMKDYFNPGNVLRNPLEMDVTRTTKAELLARIEQNPRPKKRIMY